MRQLTWQDCPLFVQPLLMCDLFDVRSSNVLLTLVSSLVGCMLLSKQIARAGPKEDTAHIICAHILLIPSYLPLIISCFMLRLC